MTPAFARLSTITIAFLALSACATSPVSPPVFAAGQQAVIEGEVVSVDTNPWAYDGNAVIAVSTSSGPMQVHLPARWNLCKAEPLGDVQALQAGDRVHVAGTIAEPGTVVVCEQSQHHLRKVE